MFWMTVIYALNKLDQRRGLWEDIVKLQQQGPWYLVGDFNNTLNAHDRIGGTWLLKRSILIFRT